MTLVSRFRLLIAALVVAALDCAALAHHSIAAVYDSSEEQRVVGVVTDFQFVYPHPFLLVAAESDATEIWRLEMDNRGELSAIGMTPSTFKAGERVVVRGNPSRTAPRQLYLQRLDRPADGFRYEQIGTRPRISGPAARRDAA